MADYRCPENILRLFDFDEKSKRKGRKKAIEWAEKLTLEKGDIVWMPDAETGVLLSFTVERPSFTKH